MVFRAELARICLVWVLCIKELMRVHGQACSFSLVQTKRLDLRCTDLLTSTLELYGNEATRQPKTRHLRFDSPVIQPWR